MKAIVIAGTGGVEVLRIEERPRPEPNGEQILVRVVACALNRADLMQCRGSYPAPKGAPPDIPGLEYAGVVEELGPDCIGPLKPGDRVFGIVGGGGQAEFLVTHERMAVKIPENLDWDEAAAVPEVFLTAHDALENQGRIRPGETVLIHAAGSGVGTAAIQIAKVSGCRVLGTSRTAEKLQKAAELGLHVGIDTMERDFVEVVLESTGNAGVNLLIDLLGAVALGDNLRALASRGRMVVVGLLGGGTATFDMATLLRKRITMVGTTLRARPLEEKIAATRAFADRVIPWLADGSVRPVVDRVFPFDEFKAAEERLEANLGFGKIILRV